VKLASYGVCDINAGGKKITMNLREKEWDEMDWIHLALDMNQWKVLTSTVMNPDFIKFGNLLSS
jgi:hypothetical protein